MLIKIKCHIRGYTSAIVEAPSLEIAKRKFDDIDGDAFGMVDEYRDRVWVLDDVEELDPKEYDPDETTAFFNEKLDRWDDEDPAAKQDAASYT